MNKLIENFSPSGVINLPSSRHYLMRYLIAAFILNKEVTIHNVNYCDDVILTINALKALGAKFDYDGDDITYVGKEKVHERVEIEVGLSTSLLRMILPLACYLHNDVVFIGHPNTFVKPLGVHEEILESQFDKIIRGYDRLEIIGGLLNGYFDVEGDTSSSYISGLLFLFALSKAKGKIFFTSKVISEEYIDMTLKVLGDFGYEFYVSHEQISLRRNTNQYIKDIYINGDNQTMTYFAALGLFFNGIKITNFQYDDLQRDVKFLDIVSEINGDISIYHNDLYINKSELKNLDVDVSNNLDIAPLLFAIASNIKGENHIRGVNKLKEKFVDELMIMKRELKKVGVNFVIKKDEVIIKGKDKYRINNVTFNTENDHRIMMALTVFAINNKGTYSFNEAWAVNKTNKEFFKMIDSLRKPKLCVSIYSNDELNKVITKADSFALMAPRHAYIYNDDFDLNKAIKLIKKANKEVIIVMNKIYTQDELKKAKEFIEQYKQYKFLVSDLGICQIFEELNLMSSVIYDPDTLICNSSDLSIYQSFGFNATSMSNEIKINDVISSYLKTKSNLFYHVFGRKLMFYSKRKLISLYKKHNLLRFKNEDLFLMEEKRNYKIPIFENKNGIYCFRPYNISLHNEMDNLRFLKYAYVESLLLKDDELFSVLDIYNGLINNNINKEEADNKIKDLNLDIDDGFTYLDTVYIKEKIVNEK